MSYNFDQIIDRSNTYSHSIDGYQAFFFGDNAPPPLPPGLKNYIHMWIADMEIATPDFVLDALHNRVNKQIMGYTQNNGDDFYQAFSHWAARQYDWQIPKEHLQFSEGVGAALYSLVSHICKPQQEVLILSPSYPKFRRVATSLNRQLIYSDLLKKDGQYYIDFADLEQKISSPNCPLLIICHPHNPSGRIWQADELKQIVQLCKQYNTTIISDEVHCDLLRSGLTHQPLAKICPDYPQIITCMSVGKTFNMSGIALAAIIIPDQAIRQKWQAEDRDHINPFNLEGTIAAYRQGADWLKELRLYLDNNFTFTQDFLSKNLPKAKFNIPQATYLAWIDLSGYLANEDNIALFLAEKAGVLIEAGDMHFVHNAQNHIRLNLACPKATLQEGLKRIAMALKF